MRALETGPSELREMTLRFNEMADALAAQRKAQRRSWAGSLTTLRTPLSALRMALAALPPERALPWRRAQADAGSAQRQR